MSMSTMVVALNAQLLCWLDLWPETGSKRLFQRVASKI